MSATTQLITAEELYMMPTDNLRAELIKGELIKMSPAGHKHGRIVVNLTAPLAQYVKHKFGFVYGAETGFKLATNPDTVRAPDIAFVRQQQIDRIGEPEGFWPEAPDLAVEVNSPATQFPKLKIKCRNTYRPEPVLSGWLARACASSPFIARSPTS
jgi:Uma2 family endonuclease